MEPAGEVLEEEGDDTRPATAAPGFGILEAAIF